MPRRLKAIGDIFKSDQDQFGAFVLAFDPPGVQRERAQAAFGDRNFDFEFVDLSLLGEHFF